MSRADIPMHAKQEAYLGLLKKAREIDDPALIRLILKKISRLHCASERCRAAGGCAVISFPNIPAVSPETGLDPPMWWVLIKLTLAIPGSVTALLLLTLYSI